MISLQIAASVSCLFIDGRTWDMLLFTLSEFTTSTYRLQAAHFCVRLQESLSDIHPHTNPHPIIHHLLAFHLNYLLPTAFLQSLIANSVASSLLVTGLMKPLMPLPWQLCGEEAFAVVAQICKQAVWLFQSKAVCRMRSLPLSQAFLREGERSCQPEAPCLSRTLWMAANPAAVPVPWGSHSRLFLGFTLCWGYCIGTVPQQLSASKQTSFWEV